MFQSYQQKWSFMKSVDFCTEMKGVKHSQILKKSFFGKTFTEVGLLVFENVPKLKPEC